MSDQKRTIFKYKFYKNSENNGKEIFLCKIQVKKIKVQKYDLLRNKT